MIKRNLLICTTLALFSFFTGCSLPMHKGLDPSQAKTDPSKKEQTARSEEKTVTQRSDDLITDLCVLESYSFEQYQIAMFEKNFEKYENYQDWEQYYHDYTYAYNTLFDKKIKIYEVSAEFDSLLAKLDNSIEETDGAITASSHILLWALYKDEFHATFSDALSVVQAVCMMYYGGGLDADNLVQLFESGWNLLKNDYERQQANDEAMKLKLELVIERKRIKGYVDRINTVQTTSQEYYDRFMAFPSPTYQP